MQRPEALTPRDLEVGFRRIAARILGQSFDDCVEAWIDRVDAMQVRLDDLRARVVLPRDPRSQLTGRIFPRVPSCPLLSTTLATPRAPYLTRG